jgi:two-component system, sensor histidine kinase
MTVVVVFVAMVSLAAAYLLTEIAERNVLIGLGNAQRAFNHFETQRKDIMLLEAESLAATPFLRATLAIPDVDSETVRVATGQLTHSSGIAHLLVTDDNGAVYVPDDGLSKDSIEKLNSLSLRYKGLPFQGALELASGVFRVAMVPLSGPGLGSILLLQELDSPASLKQISEITGTGVAVINRGEIRVANGEVSGATWLLQPTGAIEFISKSAQFKSVTMETEQGSFFVSYRELTPEADLVLYLSGDLLPTTLSSVRISVVFGTVFALLVGLIASLWLANQIGRPILALTETTRRYSDGDFDARVAVDRLQKDELGQLSLAFNDMAENLDANRKEIIASKEAAENANMAKSTFLAVMSHEIRTPLNGVLGTANLLEHTEIDEKQRGLLDIIQQSGSNLLEIIGDILDFTKIESGKLELFAVAIDINSFVDKVMSQHLQDAQKKGLALQVDLPEETVIVEADEVRLRQILSNLVGNAIKFTDEGCVQVSLRVSVDDTQQARLCFTVQDDGIGMAEERLATIFDPFSQADETTTREFGGTGLGLAITRQLVDLMHGNIEVFSELDIGSRFELDLTCPVVVQEESIDAAQHEVAEQDSFSGTTMLLVEDVVVNQEVVKGMLSWFGCLVEIAENGQEALHIADAQAFDLIFMDCHMPILDGWNATRAIRANENSPNRETPIIALTANAMSGDRESCLAAGMNDYLSKPITVDDIGAMLTKWMRLKPADQG